MINEDEVRSLGSATISRRRLLGSLAGSAVVLGGGSLLSGCTGTSAPAAGSSASASKTASFGSSLSDDVPKRALAAMVDAFSKKSGDTITINTVPHNDFQNNINSYLQGSPDDAFTWFAGYRMRYYAAKGLVAPLDDVWQGIAGNFSEGITKASTGDDGKKYFGRTTTTPGGSSIGRASGGTGLRRFRRLRRVEARPEMKSDG